MYILDGTICLGWNIEKISSNNINLYYVQPVLIFTTLFYTILMSFLPKILIMTH